MDYEEELRTLTGLRESSPAGAVDTDGNPVTDNTELGDVDAEATTVGALRDAMFSGLPKWATMKALAPDFSAEATYTVGTYVNYNYKIWECTIAVETAGDWTGTTNWTERTIAQMLGGMSSKVDTVNTNVATLLARQVEIVVTCVTQDDVTVTGQTVTLRAGSSAQAEVYDTRAYNGQPVTFSVPKDFRYFVEVSANLQGHFAPTTATGTATTSTTAVTLTYSDTSHITTYADVKACVNACTTQAEGRAALNGIEIADTWVSDDGISTYSDPMIVVDVQPVKDPQGAEHLAAIMMRKYCTKTGLQFDAAENGAQAYASDTVAVGGCYYWGYGKDYAQATTYAVNAFCGYKGGIWKCTTAVSAQETFDPDKWSLLDAKYYDASATYAVGDYAKQSGKVYVCATAVETAESFDPDKWTQVLTSGSFQTGARVALSLAAGATVPYSAWTAIYHNDVNNTDIQVYGYGNWECSAWRQFLNSSEGLGAWWHSQHTGDCPPSQLGTTRGYMAGCSAALLAAAKPIRVPVWPWNQGARYTIDTLWLASGNEYYGVVNENEGYAFKKIADNCNTISGWTGAKNDATNARKCYRVSATGSTYVCWTRSSQRINSYNLWKVTEIGALNNGNNPAYNSYAGVPACAIY